MSPSIFDNWKITSADSTGANAANPMQAVVVNSSACPVEFSSVAETDVVEGDFALGTSIHLQTLR